MRIAIISATGKVGSLLVKEALKRGHEVTAIVRDTSKITNPQVKTIQKDILDISYADLAEQEVIINAFGTWAPDSLVLHTKTTEHLLNILAKQSNRLLFVGGAASLYVDKQHTTRLLDTAEFPEIYKPVASNMAQAFDIIKANKEVNWAYFSPAAVFDAEGVRTGKYTLGGDEYIVNSKGESKISYADYAIAMLDEAENNQHNQQRFTAIGTY